MMTGVVPAIMRMSLAFLAFVIAFRSSSATLILLGVGGMVWAATRFVNDRVQQDDLHCARTDSAVNWQKLVGSERGGPRELQQCRTRITQLEADIAEATVEVSELRDELHRARRTVFRNEKSEADRLYGRLGLTPNVPDAFLPYIRRAVLGLHPDCHPDHRRLLAQERFVEAMQVLEAIARDRSASKATRNM